MKMKGFFAKLIEVFFSRWHRRFGDPWSPCWLWWPNNYRSEGGVCWPSPHSPETCSAQVPHLRPHPRGVRGQVRWQDGVRQRLNLRPSLQPQEQTNSFWHRSPSRSFEILNVIKFSSDLLNWSENKSYFNDSLWHIKKWFKNSKSAHPESNKFGIVK